MKQEIWFYGQLVGPLVLCSNQTMNIEQATRLLGTIVECRTSRLGSIRELILHQIYQVSFQENLYGNLRTLMFNKLNIKSNTGDLLSIQGRNNSSLLLLVINDLQDSLLKYDFIDQSHIRDIISVIKFVAYKNPSSIQKVIKQKNNARVLNLKFKLEILRFNV